MADKIKFTPLYGLQPEEPFCYLLEFSGCRILLDCGWDFRFNDSVISNLKKIGSIDFILISHSTLSHLGALPYAVTKLGISCPIYSTLPTVKLGQMVLRDSYNGIKLANESFSSFSLSDIDATFSLITPLKYFQKVRLTGNGEGITISPMNAGNVLGGAIWQISRESDDIVYAVGFNHKAERHLRGSDLEAISRPSILITESLNFNVQHTPRMERDIDFIKKVMQILNKGGEVLLPTDATGRSFELLLVLHSQWKLNKLEGKFSLVFLSHTAKLAVDFANTLLEWTNDKCQKEFDLNKRSPFVFEHLRICTKMSDLEFISKPRVIFATNPFMENGFSKEVFLNIAENPKNGIILTQRCPHDTIAGKLIENPNIKEIDYEVVEMQRMEGEELEEYLQFKREEEIEFKNRQLKEQSKNEIIEVIEGDVIFDKNEGRKIKLKKKKVIQMFPMFPFTEEHPEQDDYGEFVDYNKLFKEQPDHDDYEVVAVNISKKEKKGQQFKKKNRIKLENELKNSKTHDLSQNQNWEDQKNDFSPPIKTVTKIVTTKINCSINYIDFEGLSDGQSLFNIISQISPRKLILIHGLPSSSQKLKNQLKTICSSITCPKISHQVDVTSNSVSFSVLLTPALYQNLQFVPLAKNLRIASFSAIFRGKSSLAQLKMLDLPKFVAKKRKLKYNGKIGKESVFLGEVRLAEVKKKIGKRVKNLSLIKGVVSNGSSEKPLTIKKVTLNTFSVTGVVSEDYFKARKILYSIKLLKKL